jgi:hypothetical protein
MVGRFRLDSVNASHSQDDALQMLHHVFDRAVESKSND